VGGGVAAAEGGLFGFGEEAGAPVEERLEAAVTPAIISGLVGAPFSGGIAATREARRLLTAGRQRGTRLAESLSAESGLPGRRGVAGRIESTEEAKRAAFQAAESVGTEIPVEIADMLQNNTVLRAALRRSGSQESKRVLAGIQRVEAGEALSFESPSFTLIDDLRKDLKRTADAFKRRAPDASGKVPSASKAREAQAALDELEDLLLSVEGFEEGLGLAAAAGSQRRAMASGERVFNRPAGEIEDLIAGKTVQVGKTAIKIPTDPASREAFRVGLANRQLQQLKSGRGAVKRFLDDAQTGSEVTQRLRVILGSDDALQGFLREVSQEASGQTVEEVLELMIKFGGFKILGSSLAGGTAVGLLEGF